ncbi:hypothetical protein OROGR_017748 [Orobanche gracilis]
MQHSFTRSSSYKCTTAQSCRTSQLRSSSMNVGVLLVMAIGSFCELGSAAMRNFSTTLPGQHPNPQLVANQLIRCPAYQRYLGPEILDFIGSNPDILDYTLDVNVRDSISRRELQSYDQSNSTSCALTGNPIDDCWRCDPNWLENRQRLADCGVGFGRDARGGKDGAYYVVNDSSDGDPVNPKPGTLRYGVIQVEPLWIVFSSDMAIQLSQELIFNSYKTLDGRGPDVHISGGGCITLQYITNVIIHNIHVHHCHPSGDTNVRSSPTHFGFRTISDGDGISIFGASHIWIDHCSLHRCKDGLVDAVMGSTGITISNNHFHHHNEVMLLGHSDKYLGDTAMQVTVAFNQFGKGLNQRIPRCRRGYFHIVNNDYTRWEMYAIGGSGNPTINSQGNQFIAPDNPDAKEVTKRVETSQSEWKDWNWMSEGDVMLNGAVFVVSGQDVAQKYARADNMEPKPVDNITQLVSNAGVLGGG